jgi:hypothetical protein
LIAPDRHSLANAASDTGLNQFQSLEAGMSFLADHDVVVHGNVEPTRDFNDRLRHLNIRALWRRIGRPVNHTLETTYDIEKTMRIWPWS